MCRGGGDTLCTCRQLTQNKIKYLAYYSELGVLPLRHQPKTHIDREDTIKGGRQLNKEMITSLVDKVIKVDRGGPESRVGRLLAAEEDYFTLLHDDEGIIYYNTQHIKSVTYNSKSQLDFDYELPREL